ncbi:ABC transporter ATP-binding protein [Streptococcus parasanguinis]|mgnify:FL=1
MIKIHQLTKTFGDRTVFSDLNLNFDAGKVYALIGNSGCGKTTLLNMVAKLEPYDRGSIQYKGKDLRKIKPTNYFRNELGYLFQNFGLIDNKTVSENLDLGLIGHKLDKQKKRETKEEVLDRVGLSYIQLDQKIYELSGGEAQRVALAKIILKDPPLILADELTAALDPETSQEIMDLLLTLKNKDRLIIIATHNPTIWKQADQVVSLKISQ